MGETLDYLENEFSEVAYDELVEQLELEQDCKSCRYNDKTKRCICGKKENN